MNHGDSLMTEETPLSRLDILIVEDDHMMNIVMSVQLEVAGYSFRSATRGKQALKLIREQVPAALILDVLLPDMTGYEIVSELRKNPLTCSLPLIVHTTLDLSAEDKAGLQLGPTRIVTKTTAFSDRLPELIAEITAKMPAKMPAKIPVDKDT